MALDYVFYYYYLPFGLMIVRDPVSRAFLLYVIKTGVCELAFVSFSLSKSIAKYAVEEAVKTTGKLRRRFHSITFTEKAEDGDWLIVG